MRNERSLILGDNGVRYTFTSLEWQSEQIEPEAGMRVDFEARGSDAADIYPIPSPSAMPPIERSPTQWTTGGASPATPSAVERFKAMLSRMRDQLNAHYGPIRDIVGDQGVIAAGIALLAVSSLIHFDILETIVDLVAVVGIIAGAAIAAVGIYMLGKEEGWWGEDSELSGQVGSAPAPPAGVSNTRAESPRTEGQALEGAEIAGAAKPSLKTCPQCGSKILAAAIKRRYCCSEVPLQAG